MASQSARCGAVGVVKRLVDQRPTYGYRRITALVNRDVMKDGELPANHKRVYRLMKQHNLMLEKHLGQGPAAPMTARWW